MSEALAGAVGELLDAPLASLPDDALLAELSAVFVATQRLTARVVAQVGEVASRGIPARQGASSTRVWLADLLAVSMHTASGLVKLAGVLPRQPVVAEGLASGALSLEQAQKISALVAQLPSDVGPAGKTRAEEFLSDLAVRQRLRPEVLEGHRRTVLEAVSPEVAEEALRRELERANRSAFQRRGFTLTPNGEGEYRLSGILDAAAAAYVRAAIDPISAPGSLLRRPTAADAHEAGRSAASEAGPSPASGAGPSAASEAGPSAASEAGLSPASGAGASGVSGAGASATSERGSSGSAGTGAPAATGAGDRTTSDEDTRGTDAADDVAGGPRSVDLGARDIGAVLRSLGGSASGRSGAGPSEGLGGDSFGRSGSVMPDHLGGDLPGQRGSVTPGQPDSNSSRPVGGDLSGPLGGDLSDYFFGDLSGRLDGMLDDAGRDTRTAAARRADALTYLCAQALTEGRLPESGGERPQLVVTLSWEQLRDKYGYGILDTGDQLTPETIRRLACDAKIIPAVLGGEGQVLDVGRARRLIDGSLRRALVLRDRGCAWPGCERPPRWCEAHHVIAWQDGGPTSLTNSALLCGYHHREIHRGAWEIRINTRDGHPDFIPPKHLDPPQRPRRNNIHRRT